MLFSYVENLASLIVTFGKLQEITLMGIGGYYVF